MKSTKLATLVLAGILSLSTAAAVLADASLTPEKAVGERQAAMKADGRALRGAGALTGDKAVAALQIVEQNYTKLPSLFPKDSVTDKSDALPIIWQQFDQFSAIFKKGADAATDAVAAAKAGDTGKYQADLKIIGSTCDECHSTYRAKDS